MEKKIQFEDDFSTMHKSKPSNKSENDKSSTNENHKTKQHEGKLMEPNIKFLLHKKEEILDITKKAEYKIKELIAIKLGNYYF